MSAWYRTGTISSAGNVITGAGTKWADNKMGIGTGQMLIVPGDGIVQMHEILFIDSDTQLRLVNAPAAALSGAYAIVSFYTDSVPDFARRLAAQLSYYQSQMDGWQQILTGSGSVTIIAPDGTEVTIPSLAGMVSTQEMNDAITAAIAPLMPKGGGTFTGPIILSENATAALNPITKQQFDVLNNDAFTASQVANTPWVNMTLINGWTVLGENNKCRYRKVLGMVFMEFAASGGAASLITSLPVGYRPLVSVIAPAVGTLASISNISPRLTIDAGGGLYADGYAAGSPVTAVFCFSLQ